MKTSPPISRRRFLRKSAIATGLMFAPALLKPQIWLYSAEAGSFIRLRTISSVADPRIVLSNSNWARKWAASVGTSWSHLRLGIRISMQDFGANLTSQPRFAFGMSSGTTNLYQDATTTHWLGALSQASSWVRSTGPVKYDLNDGVTNPFYLSKRVGSTLTQGAFITGGDCYLVDASVGTRSCLFLDVTKGSPNFTCNVLQPNSSSPSDVSLNDFLTQIALSTPSLSGHTSGSGVTLAVDEATNGYFDSMNIAWDRTSPGIEISDMAVVKLA